MEGSVNTMNDLAQHDNRMIGYYLDSVPIHVIRKAPKEGQE